jgi:TonB-linked SusC/RagA family outer membrane protein
MKIYTFLRILVLFPVLCLFLVSNSNAQELSISGLVKSKLTADVLPGANIIVKGSNLGTATNIDGEFELKLSGMSNATLEIIYVGYKTFELQVSSSLSEIVVELERDILRTSEIVVTGLATSVSRRNLAHDVGTVNSDELVAVSSQTLERALSGKIAGITINQNTGAPGGGIDVNLRGTSTIEGSTQPLYVVDGVIVNNAANQSGIDVVSKATGAGSATPQGQPTNRIADINPNDIESIEVLKGASAAALYGAKATNGVILITSKKGIPGKTKIDVHQQIGYNSLLNKIGSRRFTAATAEEQYGSLGLQEYNKNNGKFIDYEDEMYGENGLLSETSVSLRGGSERTQFFLSGIQRDEDGIVKHSGYSKRGAKLNFDHQLSEKVDLSITSNYTRTESDRGITGNDNSNTTFGFSLAFTPSFTDIRPKNGNYPDHDFNPSNPLHTRDVLINNEIVNRTIITSRLTWNIFELQEQALDFIVYGGIDFYSQENKIISPPETQFERNSDNPGQSLLAETENSNTNLYFNLLHNYTLPSNISFRSAAGFQIENIDANYVTTMTTGLTVTQENIDQAATLDALQNRSIQRDRGFFFQEEVNLYDEIFLTAGLRGDRSSTFGNTDKIFWYPKVSGSVRLSSYDFWSSLLPYVPEFKVRAAYGETGNRPPAGAKFTPLASNNIGGSAGLLPQGTRGAKDIRPERTKELELGFNTSLFEDKATLSFTYYRQDISDLFLFSDLPSSSGYTQEFINGGEMETNGFEISLGVVPFRNPEFFWTTHLNFSKTESEITKLTVDPFNKGGFATFLGTYRIEEGWSPTAIVGAEVDGAGDHIELGDATPDFILGLNNLLKYKNFELGFLVEWKQGGDLINLGKLITDLGGTTEDYDEMAQFRVGGTDTLMKKGDGRLAVLGSETAPYIEDGTYIKLREVSLSYSLPTSLVQDFSDNQISYVKIGVSARNLLMITDYTGYDPEVSQFGNVAVGRSVDTIPYPSSRSIYFNLSLGL